jgi:hypothetical protein
MASAKIIKFQGKRQALRKLNYQLPKGTLSSDREDSGTYSNCQDTAKIKTVENNLLMFAAITK